MCENVIVLLSIMKKKVNQSNIKRRLKKKKKVHPGIMKPLKRIRDPYMMTKKNIYNVLYDEKNNR